MHICTQFDQLLYVGAGQALHSSKQRCAICIVASVNVAATRNQERYLLTMTAANAPVDGGALVAV